MPEDRTEGSATPSSAQATQDAARRGRTPPAQQAQRETPLWQYTDGRDAHPTRADLGYAELAAMRGETWPPENDELDESSQTWRRLVTRGTESHERLRRAWERPFLEALRIRGNIGEACRRVGITESSYTRHRQRNPDFDAAVREAQLDAIRRAEAELYSRAVEGWSEPVFYAGQVCGHRLLKSDRCLELYLKSKLPEYRERQQIEHSRGPDRPVPTVEEASAQLAPYREASSMILDALLAARQEEALPALPAPAEATVPPVTVSDGRPCPRCGGPGINPYCPACHGSGRIAD